MAIKPHVKVSAALIAFGGAPACAAGANCKAIWETSPAAEAYWRVYQDWRSWTEEGILDLAVPMNYKREHISSQATQFRSWLEWTNNNQHGRSALIGVGNFVNSIEGTIRQVRRSLAPSAQGNSANGVAFFSLATSNVYSNTGSPAANPSPTPNPFSVPPNQLTPTRSYAEFASGLTTGRSVNGLTLYEPNAGDAGFQAIFAQAAQIPELPWKSLPTKGHLMGFAKRQDNTPLDTADVTIRNLDTNSVKTGATDGGGFYGGVDLAPGEYFVTAVLGLDRVYSCVATVTPGAVSTAHLGVESVPPTTTVAFSPSTPNGTNGWYTTDVTFTLAATDSCSGVALTQYSLNGGATWQPYSVPVTISQEGTTTILYRSVDRGGNVETAGSMTLKIDKTAPVVQFSANPNRIWPVSGEQIPVRLTGSGTDAISGLYQAIYVVTDEYGVSLSISPRTLSGNSSNWIDVLSVEARRDGSDIDGRLYRVVVTITDTAGNSSTATADIVVPHDQRPM